jgi:hypothetical protein
VCAYVVFAVSFDKVRDAPAQLVLRLRQQCFVLVAEGNALVVRRDLRESLVPRDTGHRHEQAVAVTRLSQTAHNN